MVDRNNIVPVPYVVIESVILESEPEHVHAIISTLEYGLLAVCIVDGNWAVTPIVDVDGELTLSTFDDDFVGWRNDDDDDLFN